MPKPVVIAIGSHAENRVHAAIAPIFAAVALFGTLVVAYPLEASAQAKRIEGFRHIRFDLGKHAVDDALRTHCERLLPIFSRQGRSRQESFSEGTGRSAAEDRAHYVH